MAENLAQLNKELEEARAAIQRFSTGTLEQTVAFDGKQVVFNKTDIGTLSERIRNLEVRLGIRTESRRRSLGVTF